MNTCKPYKQQLLNLPHTNPQFPTPTPILPSPPFEHSPLNP